MKRKELLETAAKITAGEREDHYGSPEDNFATIAAFWNAYIERVVTARKESCVGLNAADVAAMMILLKVARLGADQYHLDSWVDIAGYASCGGEIVEPTVEDS